MKIGILGSGNVGGALGTRWAKLGHEVAFGTRDPQGSDVQQLAARAGGEARASTMADAAQHGEVLVLATPGRLRSKLLRDSALWQAKF